MSGSAPAASATATAVLSARGDARASAPAPGGEPEPILRAKITVSVERLIDLYLEMPPPRDLQAAAGEALRSAVVEALGLGEADCTVWACRPDDEQFIYALSPRGWYSLPDAYEWWQALGRASRRTRSDGDPDACYRPYQGSVCHIGPQPRYPHRMVADRPSD